MKNCRVFIKKSFSLRGLNLFMYVCGVLYTRSGHRYVRHIYFKKMQMFFWLCAVRLALFATNVRVLFAWSFFFLFPLQTKNTYIYGRIYVNDIFSSFACVCAAISPLATQNRVEWIRDAQMCTWHVHNLIWLCDVFFVLILICNCNYKSLLNICYLTFIRAVNFPFKHGGVYGGNVSAS